MTVGELLYQALGFHVEDDESGDLLTFCEAWGAPLELIHELVQEGEDGSAGWSLALDVDDVPAALLPWLAQWVGVVVTPDMDEAAQREAIKEPTGWSRGRTAAIEIAGKPTLTGTQRIVLKPREPEVGIHYIRTLAAETPDPARTEARFRAAVPAWDVLDFEVFEGFTYTDLKADVADYAAAKAKYATYDDIVNASL